MLLLESNKIKEEIVMGVWNAALVIGLLLMITGFVLVGIEMVTPGFSIPGIGGTICLIASVLVLADSIEKGIILSLIIVAILIIMLVTILMLLSKGKISKTLVLTEALDKEKGYISSSDLKYLEGKKGIAHTDLRPTGVGDFDGVLFDVLSEGGYIPKETPIVIKEVQGSKLIVRAKEI